MIACSWAILSSQIVRLSNKKMATTSLPQIHPSSANKSCICVPFVEQLADFSPQFISSRGNEYFCEIDEDYLTDRFNLTGLNTEVQYYQYALDLVTDVFDMEVDDDMREQIEKSARHLYGLVHARYVVTTRGLAKMVCLLTVPVSV